ncbi:CBR-FMO-3 protein [Corchorus capsularis]|uniref:CBR-FMO-3 protein n=1 Tax=Corchorus capsularis TaxID=210143 RepID=A0A1R3HAU7_COCAP|nr:CBR-FMO-3 protein [Corchorus capsularis]
MGKNINLLSEISLLSVEGRDSHRKRGKWKVGFTRVEGKWGMFVMWECL